MVPLSCFGQPVHLELILDQLKVALDYTCAGILDLEGNELRTLGY